ncbi:MAG: aldo/keto reductase, partial [Verrucomicrobiales bacterium]|nr:aldo/keto reductase [Verrucomicrobiales bacterium]
MQSTTLGRSRFKTSRLSYGCWRLAGTWDSTRVKPAGRASGVNAI